jgi:hypothetical protein
MSPSMRRLTAKNNERSFHTILNAARRLGVVNRFPGVEQVFPGHWKGRQRNIGRGRFTKKAVIVFLNAS